MIEARAETIGSLIRPSYLSEADRRGTDVAAAEDRAVRHAIQVQESAGLQIIIDGEMRHLSFQSQMTEAISSSGQWDLDAFLWGDWTDGDGTTVNRPRPANLGVTGKLKAKRFLSADEYKLLAAHTSETSKITLPSPSLFANFYDPELSGAAYPSLEALIADVTGILIDEVRELRRLGARYFQIDAPITPCCCSPIRPPSTKGWAGLRRNGWRSVSRPTTRSWLRRRTYVSPSISAGATNRAAGWRRAATMSSPHRYLPAPMRRAYCSNMTIIAPVILRPWPGCPTANG